MKAARGRKKRKKRASRDELNKDFCVLSGWMMAAKFDS